MVHFLSYSTVLKKELYKSKVHYAPRKDTVSGDAFNKNFSETFYSRQFNVTRILSSDIVILERLWDPIFMFVADWLVVSPDPPEFVFPPCDFTSGTFGVIVPGERTIFEACLYR